MAFTRQQKWYAYQRILKQQRSAGASATFSDEALAAFAQYDSLGDGLTDAEKTAMAAYIDAEVAAGNQAKKDYETIFSLSGNNALVDYVGGKVATNVNAATQSVNGFTFDGATNYINSNYNPATDATNYLLDNAQIEVFAISTEDPSSTNDTIFGTFSTADGSGNNITNNANGTSTFRVNSLSTKTYNLGITHSNTLISILRSSSTDISFLENGISVDSGSIASVAIPNLKITIAAANVDGTTSGFAIMTASSFMAGGVMASQSSHYTNLSTLLTTLGAI